MLQGEHSAILSTFIKLPFGIKILFCLFLNCRFILVLMYMDFSYLCGVALYRLIIKGLPDVDVIFFMLDSIEHEIYQDKTTFERFNSGK